MASSDLSLNINVRDYSAILLATALVLVVSHLGLYLYHYQAEELHWLIIQLFDLDEENNIPTWYSSFLLLNNAFFLYIYSGRQGLEKIGYWKLLAVGFLILALDEVAGLHESLNTAIETNWAIFGIILVLFVAVIFVPFLLALPRKLMLLFVASGILYISGALIVELIGEEMDADSLLYIVTVAIEEGLELLGAWLFLFVLLREMAVESRVTVNVDLQ